MTSALLYLRFTSLKNLVLSRIRRLQQPKYLIGAIVGGAYFYFTFLRRFAGPQRAPRHGPAAFVLTADLLPVATSVGALVLLAIALFSWIVPDQRAGLTFSEAEIAFLFPAPVRRRTLIWYKLVNAQIAILFTAALITLVSGRWSFLGGNVFSHAAGWWVILATLNLHFVGASFAVTRLMDNGITPWRRRLAVLGLVVLVAGLTLAWIWRDMRAPEAADLADLRSAAAYLGTLFASGPLPWLLLPAKWVVAPFLAPSTPAFFLALGPALLVFVAHAAWVLRTEVSFEDASIAKSEKRAARVAAVREGNWRAIRGALKPRLAPFRLAATGRPEIAFFWKNLFSTFSIFRPRAFAIAACVIVAAYQWVSRDPAYRALLPLFYIGGLIAAGYTLFLGPQLVRQDLRSDLSNADILKTYPLRGWQVVLGEILTPAAILTGFLWLALLAIVLAFHPSETSMLTPALRLTIAAGLVPILPVICTLQLLVPNGAALFFPAWSQTMRNRSERGIEMLGQRIIFVAGQLFVISLALVPAALTAFALFFASQWLIGPLPAAALSIVGILIVLVAEAACGLWWLGQRFETFDLSSELRP